MCKLAQVLKKLTLTLLVFILLSAIAATVIIQSSGAPDFQYQSQVSLVVNDITGINPISVAKVIRPTENQEIISAIANSTGPISIGGGRYSMGGQTAYANSVHIDMRSMNHVVQLDETNKRITVQAGITWRDIQEYIDPYNLSIRIMQTYANFTVGGSLSVNVHGRYVGEGPLINSVESLQVILADGQLITADRNNHADIFYGIIGGYGGLGVITEATLLLTDNVKIERQTQIIPRNEYAAYFAKNIRDNRNIIFHNGDLYPPDYDEVLEVSWHKTDKALTIKDRLIAKDAEYNWGPKAAEFVANYSIGKSIRKNIIDPIYYSFDRVAWRNWEASYDVRELEPKSRAEKTYVLREYFIPVENFDAFVPLMKEIFIRNKANIINVSIRHASAAPENLLSWARHEVFAFVVYYQQGVDDTAKEAVKLWSSEMIDAVIAMQGTYYLPYQILASDAQFNAAYPRAHEFFALKKQLDPNNRFTNQLWAKYYPENKNALTQKKNSISNYYRNEEQTVLTIPEWYLVFNPLEYADYLASGANPSDFPFLASLNEYWSLYDRAVEISAQYPGNNSQYMTMLQVIGVSTTIEYMYKSLYENTLGRFTRWTASGENTQEDQIIMQAQRAYSDLIFHEAWYVFDFKQWVYRIWAEPDFFADNFIRKLERKLFFTAEFGFKAFYAKLIGAASQAAYDHDNGLIYLLASIPEGMQAQLPSTVNIVSEDGELFLLSIPKWGVFTETLPQLVKNGIGIEEISGNRKIAVTYISPKDQELAFNNAEKLFDSKIVSKSEFLRHAVMLNVNDIGPFIQSLESNNFALEHIYDY
jgi:FAD/FMN-containing dehydrogenase